MILLALTLLGCAQPAGPTQPEDTQPAGPSEPAEEEPEVHDFESCVEAGNPVMESYPRQCRADGKTYVEEVDMPPVETTPAQAEAVAEANNQFALDMYRKYKDKEGNIFFSPYSISTAVAMTYEGARGETAAQIKDVFNYPEDETLRAGSRAIYDEINKEDKEYKLHTANALWAEQDYSFLDEYFKTVGTYYDGQVRNMDFKNQPDKSRVEINDWVEDKTEDKIKDIIPQGAINPLTRLVLTNAIYFKGSWVTQFNETLTQDKEFRTPAGNVDVKMMERTDDEAEFNYFEDPDTQVIELPYSGEELSMLIILPKESMEQVETGLDPAKITEWKEALEKQRVDLYLPRFKFETKYMLKDTLVEMGMPLAFRAGEADLSGMDGSHDLYITSAIHQAFVEVNEEGTEAAAATAIVVGITSVMPDQQQIPVFRADHPFIFLIQQKDTGNILFMGKVNDPTAE